MNHARRWTSVLTVQNYNSKLKSSKPINNENLDFNSLKVRCLIPFEFIDMYKYKYNQYIGSNISDLSELSSTYYTTWVYTRDSETGNPFKCNNALVNAYTIINAIKTTIVHVNNNDMWYTWCIIPEDCKHIQLDEPLKTSVSNALEEGYELSVMLNPKNFALASNKRRSGPTLANSYTTWTRKRQVPNNKTPSKKINTINQIATNLARYPVTPVRPSRSIPRITVSPLPNQTHNVLLSPPKRSPQNMMASPPSRSPRFMKPKPQYVPLNLSPSRLSVPLNLSPPAKSPRRTIPQFPKGGKRRMTLKRK